MRHVVAIAAALYLAHILTGGLDRITEPPVSGSGQYLPIVGTSR
jgi:hypothetical protein